MLLLDRQECGAICQRVLHTKLTFWPTPAPLASRWLFVLLVGYVTFDIRPMLVGHHDVFPDDCSNDFLTMFTRTVPARDLKLLAWIFVQLDGLLLSPSYDDSTLRHNVADMFLRASLLLPL